MPRNMAMGTGRGLKTDFPVKAEAHNLLFPVYDWFTEGFHTTDLKDAKSLLEELK